MTGNRKHCGVWQRHSVSRRGMVCITPLSVITMVSEAGTATPAASCTLQAATQVGDDPLVDQRPRRVVQQHPAVR